MKFTLEIELGNDAMQTYNDIAWALERLAKRIYGRGEEADRYDGGKIMDLNGNSVGKWELTD